ncbi:MAG: hydrogenase iron-sulfur subunit [Deltaproteobacteria bacterium]|nr:hydrogenase iron-sulfur subunit [Deltaproteobacteria bacterium]
MDRTGVFICGGCGIKDKTDIDALCSTTLKKGAIIARTHDALCSADARLAILEELEAQSLDSVLIAACSVRRKKAAFSPLKEKAVNKRICIREQAAWSRDAKTEDIQSAAADQICMGIAALRSEQKATVGFVDVRRAVLVVGAGLCGMVAADAIARLGFQVYLVEKDEIPGGFLKRTASVAPFRAPYNTPAVSPVEYWSEAIACNRNITLLTRTEISSISGQPGQFEVDVGSRKFVVGAVIQATGATPVPLESLPAIYDLNCADIVTGADFEKMLVNESTFIKPSNGTVPKNVVFIQCAGSRDSGQLPYCSRECCQITLKQIHQIQKIMPGVECQVIYQDMRTTGMMELFYSATLELENVSMIKGDVKRVTKVGDQLTVFVANTVLGEQIHITTDLVVAATGMVPNAADGEAIRAIRDAKLTIEKNESAEQVSNAQERIASLAYLDTPAILNLDYRQGPDLPQLAYRFLDSHFICFPYETRRTGIYAAGTVRAPMDIAMGISDAKGAALMAVQCIEGAARGESALPRIADIETADFFMQRCTQCKRCTEECPYGALNEDAKGTPLYNPTRCRRCGICLGACPERIVSFPSFSIDTVVSMIKAPEIPDEFEEKPRILVFMCENDAAPALDAAVQQGLKINPWVRFIEIRCLGSFHNVWVADALSHGYDGVLLMGCKQGDDYQCHNIQGSALAHTRIANIGETLDRLALEKDRVRVVEVARDESAQAVQFIEQFTKDIEALGPNPLKGF